jgi:hypothetical protein
MLQWLHELNGAGIQSNINIKLATLRGRKFHHKNRLTNQKTLIETRKLVLWCNGLLILVLPLYGARGWCVWVSLSVLGILVRAGYPCPCWE